MRGILLATALAVTLASCDGRSIVDDAAAPTPTVRETSEDAEARPAPDDAGERAPSERHRKVVFRRMAGQKARIRHAIADLKRIGAWWEVTGHLYQIDLSVKAGRKNVPRDRHLADARFWRVRYGEDDRLVAIFCAVRFFPSAIHADLERWRSLYAEGLTSRVPPTVRQLWAGILAHELFHCPPQGRKTRPEPAALAWEQEVVSRLAGAGIE